MYEDIEIEVVEEDGEKIVYIAHSGSSGWKATFKTKKELIQLVKAYVEEVIDYEYEE